MTTLFAWRQIVKVKGGDAVPRTRKGESFSRTQKWLGNLPRLHILTKGI